MMCGSVEVWEHIEAELGLDCGPRPATPLITPAPLCSHLPAHTCPTLPRLQDQHACRFHTPPLCSHLFPPPLQIEDQRARRFHFRRQRAELNWQQVWWEGMGLYL